MLFGEDILVIKGKNPNSITVTDSHVVSGSYTFIVK
jgi:hypothetical protein